MTQEQKRKLLVATDNFLPRYDGIARFLKEILPVLQELFEVTVVCPDFGPIDLPGVRLVKLELSTRKFGDYPVPKFCFTKVKDLCEQHDIVFTQGLGPIGYAAVRGSYKTKKLVMFTHSIEWELVPRATENVLIKQFLPDIIKSFVRRQYAKCDLVLVPSENTSEVLSWNKIDAPRQIVHLGVDTKQFAPPKDKAVAKVALGLPKEAFVVGYHGRLSHEKDLKTLLRGFLRVKGATLLVVGSGVPAIEKYFSRQNVVHIAATDNVVPYLQAMDVYAFTSLTETTSLSVLEAMSCGLPVISTPVGYIRDYIDQNKNGLLIPKQNPYALAKEIEKLQTSQLLREKLGFAARKTIEKDFTWDKTRKRIKEIFEEL